MQENVKPCYLYSSQLHSLSDTFTRCNGRGSRIHSLIKATGLLNLFQIFTVPSATESHLWLAHSKQYVTALKNAETNSISSHELEKWGLHYDCPIGEGIYTYALLLAGAAFAASELLVKNASRLVINWWGGWHHATPTRASGFCYINDCVLSIKSLKRKFCKILYVDIDIHHGDGVERFFLDDPNVFTLSFHVFSPGFFPGTGQFDHFNFDQCQQHSLNIPFKEGLSDDTFVPVFHKVLSLVMSSFSPDAIVCQCGVDGLSRDPIGCGNLTSKSFTAAVHCVQALKLPVIYLGGGGYNRSDSARVFTQMTAEILKTSGYDVSSISDTDDIPEHEYFNEYGPDFTFETSPGSRRDHNTEKHINEICQAVNSCFVK